ncbi:MAG: Gfo/Idh/MocA family oxidoreductase [Actinomycetota bacterium]|nr:Gfo/Idh/MocA family oxidoreductase [Actinomycetota bacterium]
MSTVRVGLVGAGFIAHRHVDALARLEGVQVVAVTDPRDDRAAALAARVGARVHPDHRRMLAVEAPDALYVCVPPYAHGPVELAALEHGVPLFVEKPIALDLATAAAIGDAVRSTGVLAATGYQWRYLDIVDRARDLLAANPCRLVLGHWLDRAPGTEWWPFEAQSGGQLIEQTTHLFDLARFLVGEITLVRAEGARIPRPTDAAAGDIHDVSTTILRFSSGAVGSISSTCLLRRGYRIGLELICEGMALALSESELVVDDGRDRLVHSTQGDPLLREDRDFIDALRGGPCRVRAPYDEALRTHRVATAAARAAREGCSIEIRPAAADG